MTTYRIDSAVEPKLTVREVPAGNWFQAIGWNGPYFRTKQGFVSRSGQVFDIDWDIEGTHSSANVKVTAVYGHMVLSEKDLRAV